MLNTIIFDLDGTLADTIGSIRKAANMTMTHFSYPTHTYEEVRNAVGSGSRILIQRLVPPEIAHNDALIDKIFTYHNQRYAETYLEADHCYDGMKEAVCELKKRGYNIAILSNKPDKFVREMAKVLFEPGIISIAQGQTELPVKPDPAAPLDIASKLGTECTECAFVGDSEVDIMTAHNAGMYSVACSWGYRDRKILENAHPDIIIDTPAQLTDIFGSVL